MIVAFWIWFSLMAWFVPGYIAGKAIYRSLPSEPGLSVFVFLVGPVGYIIAWCAEPTHMARVHGIKRNPNKPPVLARFFGEVSK